MSTDGLNIGAERGGSQLRKLLRVGCALFVVTVAAHSPGIKGEFLSDDESYITRNPLLKSTAGLEAICLKPGIMPQYYPLTFSSFWIEYRLWGEHPAGYHFVNILLHAANSVLLLLLLHRLKLPGALAAATIFALHPVNVASVAWIAERKNLLSTAFYLMSLWYCVRFLNLDAPSKRPSSFLNLIAGLILFAAALMSKTVACTLPVTVILLMWWRRRRIDVRAAIALVPMFAMAFGMGMVTIWAENHSSAEPVSLSILQRILVAGRSAAFYGATLLWPTKLSMVHSRWQVDASIWWQYLFPIAIASLVAAAWLARRVVGRGPAVAILIFLVTLAPTSGLIPFGYFQHSFVADHFAYLPCIGLIVLGVSVGSRVIHHFRRHSKTAGTTIFVALAIPMLAATWHRSVIYADRCKLWDDTIAKNPCCSMAWNGRGSEHVFKGAFDQAISDFDKAIELGQKGCISNANRAVHFRNRAHAYHLKGDCNHAIADYCKAIELAGGVATAFLGRGDSYLQKGNHDLALADYSRAIELGGSYRGYARRAQLYLSGKRFSAALADLNKAIMLAPAVAIHYSLRGATHSHMGNNSKAILDFSDAIRLEPQQYQTWYNRGIVHSKMGNHRQAAKDYTEAIKLDNGFLPARYSRADTYEAMGRYDLARRDFTAVIRMAGSNVRAYLGRARANNKLGNPGLALEDLDRALALSPANEQAYIVKGSILTQMAQYDKLIEHWQSAMRVRCDWPEALRSLAWILATHPEESRRDDAQAMALAERACELTGNRDAPALDAAAAAYAEAGLFDKAIEKSERACGLAGLAGDSTAAEMRSRLALYKSRRPYRLPKATIAKHP